MTNTNDTNQRLQGLGVELQHVIDAADEVSTNIGSYHIHRYHQKNSANTGSNDMYHITGRDANIALRAARASAARLRASLDAFDAILSNIPSTPED